MPNNSQVGAFIKHAPSGRTDVVAGENNLSFIETSALDASNVELAFQNILTGTTEYFLLLLCRNLVKTNIATCHLEIYRIVSSKALDQAESSGGIPQGEKIQITQTANSDSKQGNKCC